MKLIANLCHSNQSSGTTIVEHEGEEFRVHWTEGYSNAVICEGGLRGSVVGVIRADGETSHADWEAIKPILEAPGEKARNMTEEEEADHDSAMSINI